MSDSLEHQEQNHEAISRNRNIEIAAREPWPAQVNLYVPLKEQMIIWAPHCLSTLCLIRKTGVPPPTIQFVRNAPEMSSTGVPPVLVVNNRPFNEFDDVANLLELRGSLLTENPSSATVESYSILVTETLDSILKYFLLYERAGTTAYHSFSSVYPWPLGLILYSCYRKKTIKLLKVLEYWSMSPEQILKKFETTIQALSQKVEESDNSYLFGNQFTKADAHLYGRIYSILNINIPEYEPLRSIVTKYKPLIDYVNNIDRDVNGLVLLVS